MPVEGENGGMPARGPDRRGLGKQRGDAGNRVSRDSRGVRVDGSSAVEALRILHDGGRSVQAIVTDLNMPRMDGFELIRRVRADRKLSATPIIVVSADTDPATPDRIAALGVTHFSRNHILPRKCAGNWSRFSMAGRTSLGFAWRSASRRLLCARKRPRTWPASWSGWTGWSRRTARCPNRCATLQREVGDTPTAPAAHRISLEERLEIQEHRIEEQAQTKVEASQKFPIRLPGWRCSTPS